MKKIRIPAIEREPCNKVKKLQEKYFSEVVTYVYNNSKFYKELFRKNNLLPGKISSLENIVKIPFTNKNDFQENNWDFLCVKQKNVVDIVVSSGTTGKPIYVMQTKKDLERLARNEEMSFLCTGTSEKDLFQMMVTLDNMFIAGLAYYLGITRLGAGAIRQGPGNALRHLKLLKELNVTGVVCVPSYMITLYNVSVKEKHDISSLKLNKGVFIGEPIRNQDMCLNNLGKKINNLWDIDVFSTYGNTEIQTSMCECTEGQGGHIHPDLVIIEIIDENGMPVSDGQLGELVVTTLQIEGMPVLRYRTGDVTFKMSKPCPCGRTAPRIGPIVGRLTQMMKVKGTQTYPGQIENALIEIPAVKNYVIETYTGENFSDQLLIKVGTSEKSEDIQQLVKEKVKAHTRITPGVEILTVEDIDKIRFADGQRKARKFIDRRRKVI